MKVFTALINLALASSAFAAAVDSRMALAGLEKRDSECGAIGDACLSWADCCIYCDPEAGWTCQEAPKGGCIETGVVPAFGYTSCCSYAVDANGACT